MGIIEWRLKHVMDEHDVQPLDIEREAMRLGYDFGKNVIYRLVTANGPKRIDRSSLAAVIAALRSITRTEVQVEDIMRFVDDEAEDAAESV